MESVTEMWKDVKGYEGKYQVSDYGQVRSIDRYSKHPRLGEWHRRGVVLKPCIVKGYHHVVLHNDGKPHMFRVHRIVLEAFCGAPPDVDFQCNHIDCDKSNNRISNLEWTTAKNNTAHAIANGMRPSGERHHRAVLKDCQVLDIVSLLSTHSRSSLGQMFGVSKPAIGDIAAGRTWGHLTGLDRNYVKHQ